MLKKRLKNPIFLIYVLVVYITLQFSWWIYLIFSLYNEIYTQEEILHKKTWMLLGEGSVFFIILILGIFVILKAFKREQHLVQQQENFVLSVTHELKTPIAAIKLFLQTLKKRELTAEKRNEIYDRSLTDLNRLDQLVNNILMTRSIENKNYYLNKVNTPLNLFIQETVDELKNTVLKHHQVTLNLSEVAFEIDKIAFRSILVNILENAAKYTPSGGKITINLKQSNTSFFIDFIDEGPGIPKENHGRVFSKFYREENEMTRKSKGTGLGLYLTKFLVKQHGGQISLGNNTPKGLIVSTEFKK